MRQDHEPAIDEAYDNHIPHSLITGLVIEGRKTTIGRGDDYGYREVSNEHKPHD